MTNYDDLTDVEKMVLEHTNKTAKANEQGEPFSSKNIEQFIEDTTRYNVQEILEEILTKPCTLAYRIKMQDSVSRIMSILYRFQYRMGLSNGITRGEIIRNLTKKYRKNLNIVLIELEKHKVISIITINGKNFYKINIVSDTAKFFLDRKVK